MSRRHYDLPPFATLAAFETAARHLSFKNAAEELSVTAGAVSHQVKALERELGIALFRRIHRGVELTPEGAALFEALATHFGHIARHLARTRQSPDPGAVTVGSTTAVAALWLSPAIIAFWQDHPDINIHHMTQDRPFAQSEAPDFYIRYGRDTNPALSHTPLYRDTLVPVASPARAAALAGCTLSDLARQWLLHLQSPRSSWTTWAAWFHALNHTGDIAPGTRVTSYSVALQMAQQGAGIALGWKRLVQPMIDSGALAVIPPHVIPAPHQFYLVGAPREDLSETARCLHDWLVSAAIGSHELSSSQSEVF